VFPRRWPLLRVVTNNCSTSRSATSIEFNIVDVETLAQESIFNLMPTLFSYCVLHDNGSAPNPFWGVCTLAICKPGIRRTAKIGDWIIGTGSKSYSMDSHLIYAMEITSILSFGEYNDYCKQELPNKVPDLKSQDSRKWVGDCIYAFENNKISKRRGPHTILDMKKDLSGLNVLLSKHFYYFGIKPVPIPTHLLRIVLQGQGYRSKLNTPYTQEFIKWIKTFKKMMNKVNALPYGMNLFINEDAKNECSK
jgi:hypothetical protein